jgi:eukaryotic-like serine/threonine-protein kinase
MSGETVFRTPITSPNYGDQFQLAVRAWVLARIREAVSDPNALPPDAETFREIKPLACLDDAVEQARRIGRRILAFVYDPAGNDPWGFHYCAAAFVTSVGKVEGLSMESSRWIVFDADLKMLEQSMIYANAQQGERIASDLAQRYGT